MKSFLIVFLSVLMGSYSSSAFSNENCDIFVARLNFTTTDDDLRDAFAEFGSVNQATVQIHRATGRSKGFGYVKMANCQNAHAAVAQLNDSELNERTILVKFANGTAVKKDGRGNGSNRGGGGYNRRY